MKTLRQISRVQKAAALVLSLFALMACADPAVSSAEPAEDSLLDIMQWREVGPYRGGRVTAVAGVPEDPMVYYMGATGGGVWKTVDAGINWTNISDGFFNVGTIGAITVADSDPNVIYVGTGEKSIRGVTTSHGDGVYKSVDAGKTWAHIGLPRAGQIARIKIHPTNPDLVYVAVQGQIWGPNPERGVYRSKDGGATWELVLKVDANTGAADVRFDPTNPRVLYATMWEHGRKPWTIHSGGYAGGVFKSTDSGDSWEKLGGGLPEHIGKVGVDVSATNPNRVYAIVEAGKGEGGLYRSDDAGASWRLMNGSRILWGRSWYYMHISADPQDENVVYVLNAPMMKSIDGGKSFTRIYTPHLDHHDHWINPNDSQIMINGNDGGAAVTFDGGKSWSSIMNQPTAQIYRLATDNLFPYRIYSGQQDNNSLAIASETFDGGIGHDDYHQVGGGESAHFTFDPDNPELVYGTSVNGTLTEYNANNQKVRRIIPYPYYNFGYNPSELRYRTNWNAPVAVSPQDPSVIYYGAQYLLQTKDRGATFQEISPDLTKNETERQGPGGGPFTVENYGGETYGTILTITPSPHAYGEVWVGSDDGLIHVTRDDGENWENVTPGDLKGALVNAIDVSPHEPGTAYVAVTGYKLNDFRPYIYKLTDYGAKWKRIDKDLPQDNFIRVVREDPERKGLLYAGGEGGLYISVDDGANWQSFNQNLPIVPITDLALRQGDLVAATQGRGIWILDDLTPLRAMDSPRADKPLEVFAMAPVEMIPPGYGGGAHEGSNPVRGVPIKYYIRDDKDAPITIEISDAEGNLVRRYNDGPGDFERCILGNMDPRSPFQVSYPGAKKGANLWVWDMQREGLDCIDGIFVFEGFDGVTVSPGEYEIKVTHGDAVETVMVTLEPDRRSEATPQQFAELEENEALLTGLANEIFNTLDGARDERDDLKRLLADYPGDPSLQETGQRAIDRINEWEKQVYQTEYQTYEDVGHVPGRMIKKVMHILSSIDYDGPPVTAASKQRVEELQADWAQLKAGIEEIRTSDIAAVNEALRGKDAAFVAPPQRAD